MKKLVSTCVLVLSVCAAMHAQHQPLVVAQRAFRGQNANIPATTLFTPTTPGMFRVSVYLDISNSAGGKVVLTPLISFADDFTNYQAPMAEISSGVESSGYAAWQSMQLTVIDLANQPIQLSIMTTNQGQPSPTGRFYNNYYVYNAYVVVEQL